MKTKIFGALAIITVFMATMFFKLFMGTWLIYCGILMLFIAICFIEIAIESHPKSKEIKNRMIDIMFGGLKNE